MNAPKLPLLAADLTFVRRNKGRVFSATSDWEEEDHEPTVGEHVMVADGSTGPLEAVIEEIRDDGTIVLGVLETALRRARPPENRLRGLWKGTHTSGEAIDEVRREIHPVLANVMGLDVPVDGADDMLRFVLAGKGYELVGEPGLVDTGTEQPDVAVVFNAGTGPKTAVAGVVFGRLREEHVAAFIDRIATEAWRQAMGAAGYGAPWIPYIYSTGMAFAPAVAALKAAGLGFLRFRGEVVVPRITILEDGTATVDDGPGEDDDGGPMVAVTGVRILARYILELTFDTGEVKVIDVEPLLRGPAFERIRDDYDYFLQVRVDPDAATIVWPNEADISPRTLYAESKPVVPTPHVGSSVEDSSDA